MPGVSTAALDIATTLDEVIGNVAGTTRRLAMARLVSMVVAQAGPTYATRAALYADLAWPSGYLAWVRADATTAYNGVYKKSGLPGAGAWAKLSDLPTSSVEAAQLAEMAANVSALQSFAARTDNPHGVTKAQVGLGNVNNTADADKPVSTAQAAAISWVADWVADHAARTDNPHGVTKAQVGLGNVDNTADADKPVSTAQAEAIAAAAAPAAAHAAKTNNPHGVTKAQVGLGNVDNTADADKPVSRFVAAVTDKLRADLEETRRWQEEGRVGREVSPGLQPGRYRKMMHAGAEPWTEANAAISPAGAALRVTGDAIVVLGDLVPIGPDDVDEVRFGLRRAVTIEDPAGDGIRMGVALYNAEGGLLAGNARFQALGSDLVDLTAEGAEHWRIVSISRAIGAGVDQTLPAEARYYAPAIRCYGANPGLDVVALERHRRTGAATSLVTGGIAPNAAGPLASRATYNAQPQGFVYLATDQGTWQYFVRTGAAGGWAGPQTFQGPAGAAGQSAPGASFEAFGAVGDGVTGDADAIEATLLSGGRFFWGNPTKTYLIERPIDLVGRSNIFINLAGAAFKLGPAADGGIRLTDCVNVWATGGNTGELIGNVDTAGAWVSHVTTKTLTDGTGNAMAAYGVGVDTLNISGLEGTHVKRGYRFSHISAGVTYGYIVQDDVPVVGGIAYGVKLDRGLVQPINNGQQVYLNFWTRRMVFAHAVGPTDTVVTLECASVTSEDGNPRILAGDQFSIHSNYNDINQIDWSFVATVAADAPMVGSHPVTTATVTLTAPVGRSIPKGTMTTSWMDPRNNRYAFWLMFGCTNCGVTDMRASKMRLHAVAMNATVRAPWRGVDPSTKPNVDCVVSNIRDTTPGSPGCTVVTAWPQRCDIVMPRGVFTPGAKRNLVGIERATQVRVINPRMYGGQYTVTINGECSDITITDLMAKDVRRTFRQANTSQRVVLRGGTILTSADYSDYAALILAGAIGGGDAEDDDAPAATSGRVNDTLIEGLMISGPTRTVGGYGSHVTVVPQGTDTPYRVRIHGVTSIGANVHGIDLQGAEASEVKGCTISGSGQAGIRGKGGVKSRIRDNSITDAGRLVPSPAVLLDGGTAWGVTGNESHVVTGTGMTRGLGVTNGATIREMSGNKWEGTAPGGGSPIMFAGRADAVTACAGGWRAAAGEIVIVGAVPMVGVTGSVVNPDLPGLEYHVLGATEAAAMRAMIGLVPTTSQSDTTAGRVTKVGDFGLGVTTGAGAPQVTLATAITAGNWSYAAADASAPVAGQSGSVQVLRGNATTTVRQIAMTGTPTREYTRVSADNGATWSAWDRSFAQSNLVGTVSQSGGAVTGDAWERGASGNGLWHRDAAYQMRVARDNFLVAAITTADGGSYRSADVTWTFPQPFAAPPVPGFAVLDPQCEVRVVSVGKSSVTFRVYASAAKNFVAVSCEAIGRWWAPGATSPSEVFSAGQKGAWFDFSNPASLYTDTTRATLITAPAASVAGITDLSGNGVHLAQSTPSKRGAFWWGNDGRGGVDCDGVDDCYASVANLDLASSQVTILAAYRKTTDASTFVCELGPTAYSTPNTFALIASPGGAQSAQMYSRGASGAGGGTITGLAAPVTCVAVGRGDTATPLAGLRVNKGAETIQTAAQGGGNYAAQTLNIGSRNGGFTFPGRLVEIIIRAGLLSEADITSLTDYLYAKAGA